MAMKWKIAVVVVSTAVLAVAIHWAWRILLMDPYGHSPHQYTRAELRYLGWTIETYRKETGCPPRTLDELTLPGPVALGPYAKPSQLSDRWGRPYYYRRRGDCNGFVLFSLGGDGRIGGDGQDADIAYGGDRAEDSVQETERRRAQAKAPAGC